MLVTSSHVTLVLAGVRHGNRGCFSHHCWLYVHSYSFFAIRPRMHHHSQFTWPFYALGQSPVYRPRPSLHVEMRLNREPASFASYLVSLSAVKVVVSCQWSGLGTVALRVQRVDLTNSLLTLQPLMNLPSVVQAFRISNQPDHTGSQSSGLGSLIVPYHVPILEGYGARWHLLLRL